MSKRCKCGVSNNVFCSTCSRFKMVMNLKNNYDHLKLVNRNTGELVNPVWFSVLSKDNKPYNSITTAMLRRFAKSNYVGATRNIQFYDNQTKELIQEFIL